MGIRLLPVSKPLSFAKYNARTLDGKKIRVAEFEFRRLSIIVSWKRKTDVKY